MFRKNLKRGIVLAAALAYVGPLQSTAAIAQPFNYAYVLVYYKDATRNEVVGRETVYCDGTTESYGVGSNVFQYYNGTCP